MQSLNLIQTSKQRNNVIKVKDKKTSLTSRDTRKK